MLNPLEMCSNKSRSWHFAWLQRMDDYEVVLDIRIIVRLTQEDVLSC